MNPADVKHIAPGQDPGLLPLSIGYEVAGIMQALGPDTELASGGGAPGDEVVAQVTGEYTTAITTSASDAFAKPPALTFPEAANLLLAGTTGEHGVRYGRWSFLFTMASMVIMVNCVLGGATIALPCDLAFKVPLPGAASIGVAAGLALLAAGLCYEHRRLTPAVLSSYVAGPPPPTIASGEPA
jgi:hypothetical protein